MGGLIFKFSCSIILLSAPMMMMYSSTCTYVVYFFILLFLFWILEAFVLRPSSPNSSPQLFVSRLTRLVNIGQHGRRPLLNTVRATVLPYSTALRPETRWTVCTYLLYASCLFRQQIIIRKVLIAIAIAEVRLARVVKNKERTKQNKTRNKTTCCQQDQLD